MMKEEVENYAKYLDKEKKFAANTVSAYKNDLIQFNEFINSVSTRAGSATGKPDLTVRLISDYRQRLVDKEYKATTMARKVAAIRSFVKFLFKTDKLPDEMEKSLALSQVKRKIPKPLSVTEVKHLLAEPAKLSTVEAKRDRAMFELLYATGLQASELMSLNVGDVDLRKNVLHCPGRSSRKRDIAIDASVTKVIKDYLDVSRPEIAKEEETSLFVNRRGERLTRQGFWQILREYGHRAGIETEVTPRILRHSFAIHKHKSGVELSDVQKMLGHAYLTSTKVYEKVK